MPADTRHPDYDKAMAQWQRCRDAIAGNDTIKGAGDRYLPIPGGLADDSKRYKAYITRAKWFNAVSRTVDGLEGEVFRNDPTIEMPDALAESVADNVTLTSKSLFQHMRSVLRDRLIVGRYGELVEFSETLQRPYVCGYTAQNIINWRTSEEDQQLTLVVLKEKVSADAADEFDHKMVTQYRVLKMVENVYTVEVYAEQDGDNDLMLTETYVPNIRGVPLDFIPFQFYGVSENSPDIEKPPLLDLVDINIADYRNSADLEHGRHFCGLPFYYIMGAPELDDSGAGVEVGSTAVWSSSNENAKAGVIEFSGNALGALEKARAENKSEMALLGARLLEEQKMVGETAEAIARRQSGKQSVLQSMCEVQDQGHLNVLSWMAQWMGLSDAEIDVSLNKDYTVSRLDPAALMQLVAAWQAGAISKQSLFHNLQQGEIIPPDRTFDEEMEMIEIEAPDFDLDVDEGSQAGGG
jgi:hypothetical protein